MLPVGADACATARPALLPAGLRTHFHLVSRAEPFAWLVGLTAMAYATAQRTGPGRAARVTLMRVAGSRRAVRRALDERSGLDLLWNGQASRCSPDACPTVAGFAGPDGLRSGLAQVPAQTGSTWLLHMQSGSWPRDKATAGVELHCRRLARAFPEAVEVSARRRTGPWLGAEEQLPLSTTAVTHFDRSGIDVERVDLMPDLSSAEQLAGREPRGLSSSGVSELLGGAARRRQVDLTVRTSVRVTWEDLSLSSEDLERHRAAAGQARALARLRPRHDLDAADIDTITEQVRLRLDILQYSQSDDPGPAVHELCAVLERGLSLDPQDPRLADAIQRLCDMAGTACNSLPARCPPTDKHIPAVREH